MGVDGVVETITDELFCYQAKFRRGRAALTWTELATFFGLTDSGNGRLVFTNCDDISEVAEQRPAALFVRGSDLDRLTVDDFRLIEGWLAGTSVPRTRKSPLPHQTKAVARIVAGLNRHPRATALMACGTGKTLVSLWVAEELNARSIIVLLPSLALVRQTLHEWLHEMSWASCEYLCVCSDPSVHSDADALIVRPSDVDFKVTTEVADVQRFLQRSTDAVRIVFSTYQSSSVVAEAAGGNAFDFGVFDEAHKTAGRDGAKFSLPLKDERLAIRRRLFLTATPRHYSVASKGKAGDATVLFSMDAPEVYGPVVHRLPFSTAAKLGIITDYKVLISIVTSEMVTDELLRRGVVLVDGEEVKARQVANQIALQSVVKQYDVHKIFTFHSKVESARSFTSSSPEGIATHLREFHCGHINGKMPTALRERRMREFEAAPRAIMSNARCLTEGVDVPAVDMVAFLSPRRSLVDIVQAAGRAMRRSEGKRFGYVLVPLYVEQARGETIEQAVVRSDFAEVWNVLNRLQEHDDLLAQTIARMRVDRGRTGGFDDSAFRDKVELVPPELSFESLRAAITAACLEAIGDTWFERYGQLISYRERFGDCDVPARWPENKPLGTWVRDQRVLRRRNALPRDRVALLDKIAFNWSLKSHTWRSNYLALIAYKETHGDCRVPQIWPENQRLATWVSTQRDFRRRNRLTEERTQLLEKIGFEWFAGKGTWEERFQEVLAFRAVHGHCRVPARWKENPQLGSWVVAQRTDRRKGELRPDYEARLDEIGFEWDLRLGPEAAWHRWVERLRHFIEKYGTYKISHSDVEFSGLAKWMARQRRADRDGQLTPAARSILESLGFPWTTPRPAVQANRARCRASTNGVANKPARLSWDDYFAELERYFTNFGDCDVPQAWHVNRRLGRWVSTQRELHRVGRLAPERKRRLDNLGFRWESRPLLWEAMFEQLKQQLELSRSGLAPHFSAKLRSWMLTQRQARKRGELQPEREAKLSAVGFIWEPFTARWQEMFEQLQRYQAEYGDCDVPTAWPQNPQLANWVTVQRRKQAAGKLTPEQTATLDSLGFAWRPGRSAREDSWNEMMRRLIAFHAEHGHANVSQKSADDPSLGRWVMTQRAKRKRGKLSDEQVAAFDCLNFVWSPRESRSSSAETVQTVAERNGVEDSWAKNFEALKRYKEKHGDCLVSQRWGEDRALAYWVTEQRMARNRSQLDPMKEQQLTEIGFDWNPTETAWNDMFEQLAAYKREHGHTDVPQKSGRYRKLACWVHNQRAAKKLNRPIMAERENRLNSLGFSWALVDPLSWDHMFDKLVAYKAVYGHCKVPQHWKDDPRFGKWVNTQRTAFKRGKLSIERRDKLESIGFVWNTKTADAATGSAEPRC